MKHTLSMKKKFENRMKHSKKGTVVPVAEKTKSIVTQVE